MKALNIARMDWDKLRWFYLMAQHPSLYKAASALKVAQSQLSRHLADLESTLGMKLFARKTRGITLLQEGQDLLTVISRFFQEFTQYEDRRLSQQKQVQGALRVSLSPVLPLSWLIRDTASFSAQYPDIQLSFVQPQDSGTAFIEEVDCSLRPYDPSQQEDMIQQPLMTLHYGLYASKAYLERFQPLKTLADINNHPWILLKTASGQNQGWPNNMTEEDHSSGSHTFTTAQDVLWAAQQGLGIAALPTGQANACSDLVALPFDLEETKVDLCYVYPKHHQYCKRITLYGDFLKQTLTPSMPRKGAQIRPSPRRGQQERTSRPLSLPNSYKDREQPSLSL